MRDMGIVLFFDLMIMVALAAAFVVLLAKKLGAVEWLQVHGDKYLSRMASCDFCMSFWSCTIIYMGLACVYDNPMLIFGGIVSCPLARVFV